MAWIMWLFIALAQSIAANAMYVVDTKLLNSHQQLKTMAAELYPYEIKGQYGCCRSWFTMAPMPARLATHQSPLQQTTSMFRLL
jgi:hypothetical protein